MTRVRLGLWVALLLMTVSCRQAAPPAAPQAGATATAAGPKEVAAMEKPVETMPLRALADQRRFWIGAAVDASALRREPRYAEVVAREFNALTTENALKFEPVQPARDRYAFADADTIVDFAQAHNMRVRGHTLVWHQQVPAWLSTGDYTREELTAILRDHIETVVGRYRGRVAIWDVANEAVADDGSPRDTLWRRGLGPEYLDLAFRWAHEADPDARLFYNDYGGEGLGSKSDAIYDLVKGMRERGVPIAGVGLQMHVSLRDHPRPEDVTANIRRLGELGLEVQITELDVRIPGEATPERLAEQGRVYGELFDACLTSGNCTGLVLWGFTDRHSWIPHFFPGTGAALIFDDDYRPKPAYQALREGLAGAR